MQARARLGLLPALLPAAPPPVTPAPLLDVLGQHASHAESVRELEPPLLPLLPQLAALNAEHVPGKCVEAALALVDKLPEPELSDLPPCDAEGFMLDRYARCMPVPKLEYLTASPLLLSLTGSGSAPAHRADPLLLEHLLLPPFATAADIRSDTAAAALAACMPVKMSDQDCSKVLEALAGGTTFMSLLAAEQVCVAPCSSVILHMHE